MNSDDAIGSGAESSADSSSSDRGAAAAASSNNGNNARGQPASRSSVCTICQANKESFHLNYGASSCLSCRAFFRRTIQNAREPKFVCKDGSQCMVTLKTRRRCKRCRFDLCLKAGMKPEYVLNDNQIMVRFRRMIRKKRRKEKDTRPSGSGGGGGRSGRVKASATITSAAAAAAAASPEATVTSSSSTMEAGPSVVDTSRKKAKDKHRKKKKNDEGGNVLSDTNLQLKRLLQEMIELKKEEASYSASAATEAAAAASIARSALIPEIDIKLECVEELLTSSCPDSLLDVLIKESGSPILESTPVTPFACCDETTLPALKLDDGDLESILFPKNSPDETYDCVTDKDSNTCSSSFLSTVIAPSIPSTSSTSALSQLSSWGLSNSLMQNGSCGMQASGRGLFLPQQWQQQQKKQQQEPVFLTYVRRLRHCWSQAFQPFHPSSEALSGLIGLQNRCGKILGKQALKTHTASISDLFRRFALLQSDFTCLSSTDQHTLLTRNTPLFVQYLLGRYFCSASSLEQIQWLLLGHPAAKMVELNPNIPSVTMMEFNGYLRLFQDGRAMQLYVDYASRLQRQPVVGEDLDNICIVAAVCLYSSNYATLLEDPGAIRRNLQFMQCVADWAHERYGSANHRELSGTVEILEAMANSFSVNVNWDACEEEFQSSSTRMALEVTPRHGHNEELWLQLQVQKLDEAHDVIPFGETIMNETVMYHFDVPFSKKYFPVVFKTMAERFRFLLQSQNEFNCLSVNDQNMVLTAACFDAVALQVCYGENLDTGYQQITHLLGTNDREAIDRYLGHNMPSDKLKKISMRDNELLQLMQPTVYRHYINLVDSMADLVQDNEACKLLTLITVFANDSLFSMRGMENLPFARYGKHFMNVTRRKLMQDDAISGKGGTEEVTFAKFRSALNNVKEISALIQSMVMLRVE